MKTIRFKFVLYRYLINWVELLEIAISILTFTTYRPWWSVDLIAKLSRWWYEERMINKGLDKYRFMK